METTAPAGLTSSTLSGHTVSRTFPTWRFGPIGGWTGLSYLACVGGVVTGSQT